MNCRLSTRSLSTRRGHVDETDVGLSWRGVYIFFASRPPVDQCSSFAKRGGPGVHSIGFRGMNKTSALAGDVFL